MKIWIIDQSGLRCRRDAWQSCRECDFSLTGVLFYSTTNYQKRYKALVSMLLHWDDNKYHNLDVILTVVLVAGIVAFMFAWYFEVLPYNMLTLTILPVGLSHWYKRKLGKLFKTYGGAYVTVDAKKLILSKPDQDFEVTIKFSEIQSVKSSHWLLLDKMKLSLKGGREVELVNFLNQNTILKKINP